MARFCSSISNNSKHRSIIMKRTNLTNFYQKFHRNRVQKNQEKVAAAPPPPPLMEDEHDLDDLLEYDDEFSRVLDTSLDSRIMNSTQIDGVPLSVELAQATSTTTSIDTHSSQNTQNSQEIFLRLPSGSGHSVVDHSKPSELEFDELDESIYENSSKAATPASASAATVDVDNEQILFEGEKEICISSVCQVFYIFCS